MLVSKLLRALTAALTLAAASAAQASPSGVVISQVYGGNGGTYNRDYVELFNAGSAPVSISGWSVQYASATGTGNFSGNSPVVLTGTLQPGQYHLVALVTAAGGAALPTPDATATSPNLSGTAGKVALVRSTTGLACNGGSAVCSPAQLALIEDLLGYGTANFSETSAAPATSGTTAAFRANQGCTDTDNNNADFSITTPAPRNAGTPLAPCGSGQPVLPVCPASINVAQGSAVAVPLSASDADDVVNATAFVSGNVPGMLLTGFVASPSTGAVATVDLNIGASVAVGSYPVVVRFTNASAANAACTVNVTVGSGGGAFTPIYNLQGSGTTSPFNGQVVTTRGVVTKLNNNGYFIQDATGDGNPLTSDGLFVFTSTAPTVSVGQLIEVSGSVTEFNVGAVGNALTAANPVTELVPTGAPLLLGTGSITPTPITLPETTVGEFERFEGMLVTVNTPLTVSQNYFQGRYGQVTLSALGRLLKPTQVHRPGTPAAVALQDQNQRASILLDDGTSAQNPNPIPYIGIDNTLRAGDTLPSVTGVLDYGLATASNEGLADWRIHPTVAPAITRVHPRLAAPAHVGGNLKVASFNVLNYFTTFTNGQTASGQSGQGCAPSNTTSDCRGADSLAEFSRQQAKIVTAIVALDADVVGLMEIQNNGNTAAQNLVDALNAVAGANTYAVTPLPPTTGTDAIRVAMIHKPARVATFGAAMADSDAIHNRPPLAQTFRLLSNNERFSVVVNHFKSKSCGSASGADADQGDGQGCYNERRTQQAQRLLTFIGSVQSAAADNDVLVIGDINAYGQEDPMFTFTQGGLVDQGPRFESPSYSYVFDGEIGTLDHALATASLSARITGSTHWHINADEPSVIDYNTEFKPQDLYAPNAFRSSDHDPVVIGIDLTPPQAQSINFAALADRVLGETGLTLSASSSSGLVVAFSSLTPAVCTVSGTALQLLTVGTCTVAADQPGNAAWWVAPQVTRSFVVRQAQTLSFNPLPARDIAQGGFVLAASASSGLAVSYVSNTPAVCTVVGANLSLLTTGLCSITASQPGDGLWATATAVTQAFDVTVAGGMPDGDVPLPLWALALLGAGLMGGLQKRRRG